jgi:RNA polymerase sigma-70 factor (ECF subfamily)
VADARTSTLFTEHRQVVFRYLCRTIGHAETARDLTQDVFVRISGTRVPDADAAHLRAWVFRIARNLVADHFRRQQRRPETAMPAREAAGPASQETGAVVAEALAALAELDRDVFLMRELGGLSYEEIARACDLTRAAVRSRIHRARHALRESLRRPIEERAANGIRLGSNKDN